MNHRLPLSFLVGAGLALVALPACSRAGHDQATSAAAPAAAEFHPLQGVVVEVLAERGQLVVKHEAVPGVMRGMTMGFHVEPAGLTEVKQGDAITAMVGKDAEGRWSLREVKVVPPAR